MWRPSRRASAGPDPTQASGPAPAKSRDPLPAGFFVLWSTVAIDLIGFGIVLPILPQYAEQFNVSPVMIGVIFASFSVAQLIFAPVWGRLSDGVGRKPILIVSLFGTALGSLLTGVAGGVALLLLGRIIDGASGASVSVAQAAAADLAPPHQRARLMGLLGAAFGVGFVAGPAIGAVGSLFGTRVPFFIAAAISFVNAVVALKRLPETADIDRHPDTAEQDSSWIAAAPALNGPGIVEPAHLDLGIGDGVDSQAIVRLIVVSFVAMVAFSGFEATFALLGQARLGLQQAATGAVFTVIGIALVVVQGGLVGRVNDRLGEITTIRAGLGANVVGLLILAVNGGWATLVPALVFLVVGQGLLTPTLSSAVAGRSGRDRGHWLGWQQSVGGLARVIGPITAGFLFQQVGLGAPYVVGAALVAGALVLSLAFRRDLDPLENRPIDGLVRPDR